MMRDPRDQREPKEDFPFRTIRFSSLVLILVGIFALAIGFGDVIYTAAKYTSGCDNAQFDNEPCSNSILVWTWTASGIWGGIIFIATGVIGWRLLTPEAFNLKFNRDLFGVFVVVGSLIAGPAMLALGVLEVVYGLEVFYSMEDGNFVLYDFAKILLPSLCTGAGLILWIVSTIATIFVCCCAHFEEDPYEEDYYDDRYKDPRRREDDYSYRRREDDYPSRRRSPRRRSRRLRPLKRLGRRPRKMPVERVSPIRQRTYDYPMPRRALPSPRLPAIPLPSNESPYALTASNLSLGSMARPIYGTPYSPYSFGSPWGGYA